MYWFALSQVTALLGFIILVSLIRLNFAVIQKIIICFHLAQLDEKHPVFNETVVETFLTVPYYLIIMMQLIYSTFSVHKV